MGVRPSAPDSLAADEQRGRRSLRIAAYRARAVEAEPSAPELPSADEQRGGKSPRVPAVGGASSSRGSANSGGAKKGKDFLKKLPVRLECNSFSTNFLTLPQRLTNDSKVPVPIINGPLDFALSTEKTRGHAKRCEKALDLTRKRLAGFLEEAPTFQLPWRLDDLDEQKGKPGLAGKLEKICNNELGPGKPERCFSAKYVDLDGNPVCFYFGYRLRSDTPAPKASIAARPVCLY